MIWRTITDMNFKEECSWTEQR